MGLVNGMSRSKARTVMGIDSSTQSLAFAVFSGQRLIKFGKINFEGNTSYERLADSLHKIESLSNEFDVDYIAIEKAIMVRSTGTAIKLGMAIGVIIAAVLKSGTEVVEVAPIQWQSYIGNKNYNATQKAAIKKKFPGKSVSWYKEYIREQRKLSTINFFNKKFKLKNQDNDVADAMGVGWYAVKELTE
jgi:Holliday junction resolvasome RuvABC endonuclease subunit